MKSTLTAFAVLLAAPAAAQMQAVPPFDPSTFATKSDLAGANAAAANAQAVATAAQSTATTAQSAANAAQTVATAAQTAANTAQSAATAAQTAASAAKPGKAAYVQTAYGPNTTGANTSSLMGGTAIYGFGSSGGLPILRCDYVGQAYSAVLHGIYGLATTTPGNVDAILVIGGVSQKTTIGNLLAGTPGAWWDAEADIVCAAVGTNTATVNVGVTLTFQGAGGITAAMPLARSVNPYSIITSSGAFTLDLQRTFTNAANTMQVQTLSIMWVG